MKIILDSSCDIPESYAKKYDIDIVPIYVNIDGKTYLDRYDLTPKEFYQYLRENRDNLPKTSGTSPKEFFDRITANVKEKTSIFVSTISSKLSTTYQSARIAIKRFKDKEIHLVDSLSGSGGLGLLGISAAKLAKKGIPDQEIVARVEEMRDNAILMGYVDDLYNLHKSGRISHMKFFVSNLLRAKPILTIQDGILTPVAKAPGKAKAIKKMIKKILQSANKSKIDQYDLMITHADDEETATNILSKLDKKLKLGEKIINFLTPALSIHLGLGTIVVCLVPSP
ncbi:MAG: DegV family protein [Candidatus Heimdallarchaeaceae archaeon]